MVSSRRRWTGLSGRTCRAGVCAFLKSCTSVHSQKCNALKNCRNKDKSDQSCPARLLVFLYCVWRRRRRGSTLKQHLHTKKNAAPMLGSLYPGCNICGADVWGEKPPHSQEKNAQLKPPTNWNVFQRARITRVTFGELPIRTEGNKSPFVSEFRDPAPANQVTPPPLSSSNCVHLLSLFEEGNQPLPHI